MECKAENDLIWFQAPKHGTSVEVKVIFNRCGICGSRGLGFTVLTARCWRRLGITQVSEEASCGETGIHSKNPYVTPIHPHNPQVSGPPVVRKVYVPPNSREIPTRTQFRVWDLGAQRRDSRKKMQKKAPESPAPILAVHFKALNPIRL